MTPTPEQIAAMEARGWTTDYSLIPVEASKNGAVFWVHVRPIFIMRVWYDVNRGTGWHVGHGGEWHSDPAHPDPQSAADEAEAWLRSVLAPLRFPWLHIDKETT